MQFNLDKVIERGIPAATSVAVSLAILLGGITAVEQKIVHVEDKLTLRVDRSEARIDRFEMKQILPEASVRLAGVEHDLAAVMRRLGTLEMFKTQGARCTFTDCKRIETRLDKVQTSQTACLTSLATIIYRLELAENRVQELHFHSDIDE